MESPAGWYPDPAGNAATTRYWDGVAWTGQTRPQPVAPFPQPAPAPPQPATVPQQPAVPFPQSTIAPPQPAAVFQQLAVPFPQPVGAPPPPPMYMPLQPGYAPVQDVPAFVMGPPNEGRHGLAVAGFVLGVLSIVFSCLAYLSLLPALLAIIFGALGIKSSRKGLAIAGLIMGVVGALLGIAVTLIIIAIASQSGTNPSDYFESTFF